MCSRRSQHPTRGLLALLALVATAVTTSGTAFANPCELGSALAQNQSGSEADGIGGTGLGRDTDRDSGVGGTGLVGGSDDDSGMGGTGVIGTITGFASICVNGLEIEYTPDTPTDVDGQSASSEMLGLGHVVAIEAYSKDGRLRARRIAIRHLVEGRLSRIDRAARLLWLVGQRVELSEEAQLVGPDGAALTLEALEAGDLLAVSGLRSQDGVIATRVARVQGAVASAASQGRVPASLAAAPQLEDGILTLGGVRIEARSLPHPNVLSGALVARATGHFDPERGVIENATVETGYGLGDVRRLSIEGILEAPRAGHALRLRGFRIDGPGRDMLGRARARDRVVVQGRLKDRSLRVEHVMVNPRPQSRPSKVPRGRIDSPRSVERQGSKGPEQIQRPGRPRQIERPERPKRPKRVDRPDRPRRPDRPERPRRPRRPITRPGLVLSPLLQ